jgi:hypothetical protein
LASLVFTHGSDVGNSGATIVSVGARKARSSYPKNPRTIAQRTTVKPSAD